MLRDLIFFGSVAAMGVVCYLAGHQDGFLAWAMQCGPAIVVGR